MLGSALMIVVYIITGLAVVVGGVLGAAWLLAREINAGHEPSCPCPNCQRRRQREWQANNPVNDPGDPRRWGRDRKPQPNRSVWVSTLELQQGSRVLGKKTGTAFRVESIRPIPYGFMVVLTGVPSGQVSRIPIDGGKAHHKIWLVHEPKRGGA